MASPDAKDPEQRIRKIAAEARTIAIIGILILGVLLGPIALWRVAVARKKIKATGVGENLLPHLKTSQQIAVAAIIVWAIGPVLKLSGVL